VIVAYIDGHRARLGVEPICRVLSEHGMQIAPSTYYAALKTRVSVSELADAYLVNALVDLYRANRSVYGCRKLWHQLRRSGHLVGRDQVGRLMGIGRDRRGGARQAHDRHDLTRQRVRATAPGPDQARLGHPDQP
jgi:putative transposase